MTFTRNIQTATQTLPSWVTSMRRTLTGTTTTSLVIVMPQKTPHKVYLYKRANFDKLREDMSAFSNTFLGSDPLSRTLDENWTMLKEALLTGIKDNIPTKMTKTNRSLPWITNDIQAMIRKKDRLHRKATRSKSNKDWDIYKLCRNATQKMQAKSYDNYIRNVIGASLTQGENQKKFWSFVRLNKSENLGIPVLSSQTGLHITDTAKADALNAQFTSFFTHDNGKDLPHLDSGTHQPMDDFIFTQPGIEKLLSQLKPNKASGPDELPACVLKETSPQISAVVTVIFQQSYEQGILPSEWSNANISAIYKKGDKSTPSNYRPVSLTCILCKTMEHVVTSQIHQHLERHGILHPNQHGFRKGLSCETQLISTIQDWASNANNKNQTDVVCSTLAKRLIKCPTASYCTRSISTG